MCDGNDYGEENEARGPVKWAAARGKRVVAALGSFVKVSRLSRHGETAP
jgi:hypothetical protein